MNTTQQRRSAFDLVTSLADEEDRGDPLINHLDMILAMVADARDRAVSLGNERALRARHAMALHRLRIAIETAKVEPKHPADARGALAVAEDAATELSKIYRASLRRKELGDLAGRIFAAVKPEGRALERRAVLVAALAREGQLLAAIAPVLTTDELQEQAERSVQTVLDWLAVAWPEVGARMEQRRALLMEYLLACRPGRKAAGAKSADDLREKLLASVQLAASTHTLRSAKRRAKAKPSAVEQLLAKSPK